ncbi:MAG TPA: polysaccharide biosynthesis tyrosine autokinase [Isosphaeraceae bacterium]|jgi:capsular exopolysaccharide synthesis family protein|nr:polysaccharide biosynthesis tyrosine autokinase [Isosphaeraceae bacterium]
MQPQLQTPARAVTSDKFKFAEDLSHVVGMLRRGWRFIAVAVAISVTLAVIHLARTKTVYQASARLLVLQQGGRGLNVSSSAGDVLQSMRGPNDSLETHVMIMRSPLIVERALAAAGLLTIKVDSVIDRLSIKLPDAGARVLQIDYKAESRDEALRLTSAIIQSYDRFLKDNYQKNTNEVITLIIKARDDLSRELQKLEGQYLEFRQKNPAYTADEKGRPFASRRLDQWDQAANQAMVRALQLQSQLELGRKLSSEGAEADTVYHALNQLGGLAGDAGGSPPPPGQAGIPATPHERLEVELAEVEYRRKTAERLVAHLRAAIHNAESPSRVNDGEIAEAFNADPAVAEIRTELRRLRTQLSQAQKVSRRTSDPVIVADKTRIDALQSELVQLWRRKRPAIVAQLSRSVTDSIRETETELMMLKAKETALRDHLQEARADRLRELAQRLESLSKRHGPEHPEIRQVEDQITKLKQGADAPVVDPAKSRSLAVLGSIERSLEAIEAMQHKIQDRIANDLSEAKKAEINVLAESNLRNNLERHRTLFNSVVDQLKQVQLISDFGSVTAQTINPPSLKVVRPQTAQILLSALVIGCTLGGFAAFISDLLDARIRSMSEVRRVLDIHVLGVIPQLPAEQKAVGGEIGLISHAMPRSPLSESYKSVRTTIEFLRRNQNAQVLLITSPRARDGKSTTASNLGISLAHAGRRVLLIDGDLRQPCQHKIHDLRRDRGLVQVLQGLLPFSRAVQRTQIENLDMLTAGPDVSNPAELLASHRLGDLLDEARQTYDVVIVDSSPLLAITDPSIIAAAVDRIVLIARASVTRLHDAERAVETIRSLGTPLLGAIINGLTPDLNGFGYGYGYGYGYKANGGAGPIQGAQKAPAVPVGELTHGDGNLTAIDTESPLDRSAAS